MSWYRFKINLTHEGHAIMYFVETEALTEKQAENQVHALVEGEHALPLADSYEMVGVVAQHCKFCQSRMPKFSAWSRYHEGLPVCDDCWDDRLRTTG